MAVVTRTQNRLTIVLDIAEDATLTPENQAAFAEYCTMWLAERAQMQFAKLTLQERADALNLVKGRQNG